MLGRETLPLVDALADEAFDDWKSMQDARDNAAFTKDFETSAGVEVEPHYSSNPAALRPAW